MRVVTGGLPFDHLLGWEGRNALTRLAVLLQEVLP